LFETKLGCFEDTHHDFYPASEYSQGVANVFRELPENKRRLCRAIHNSIHAEEEPPVKPDRAFMLQAIARQLTKDLEALNGEGQMAG
jgi:hypothetical protein